MRPLALAFTAALAAAPAAAADLPGDLQQLCEKLCGTWQQDGKDTLYTYERDEQAGLIRGLITSPEGGAAIVLYGWDSEKKELWMLQTVTSQPPSIGPAALTSEGFTYSMKIYGGPETTTGNAKFDGPDSYTDFFSYTGADGLHGDGAAGPYKRISK